ncbi:hypothetical protein D3C86_2245250 [compost metagenome]
MGIAGRHQNWCQFLGISFAPMGDQLTPGRVAGQGVLVEVERFAQPIADNGQAEGGVAKGGANR